MHLNSNLREAGPGAFASTRWTRVPRANAAESDLAGQALAELCEACWAPLDTYVQRPGRDREQALDLTQEFFAQFLEKHWLSEADPGTGRLRNFLLAALKRFLANDWRRAQTQKRGGHLTFISPDALDADLASALATPSAITPEILYERHRAEALVDRVMARLADEYRAHPLGWETLQRFVIESRADLSLVDTARQLGVTESALRSLVHRLRRRYQELGRAEVAETVEDPAEVEDELRHLAALYET